MPDILHLYLVRFKIVPIRSREILHHPDCTKFQVENARCVIQVSTTDREATCSGNSPFLDLE